MMLQSALINRIELFRDRLYCTDSEFVIWSVTVCGAVVKDEDYKENCMKCKGAQERTGQCLLSHRICCGFVYIF